MELRHLVRLLFAAALPTKHKTCSAVSRLLVCHLLILPSAEIDGRTGVAGNKAVRVALQQEEHSHLSLRLMLHYPCSKCSRGNSYQEPCSFQELHSAAGAGGGECAEAEQFGLIRRQQRHLGPLR